MTRQRRRRTTGHVRLPHEYVTTTGRHRLVPVSGTDRVVYATGHFHHTRSVVVVAQHIRDRG